jgi:hypothetical protein
VGRSRTNPADAVEPPRFERSNIWSCTVIQLGHHVIVKGEDEEAIVTAAHPDSQVEIEFLHASEGGPRRRRYAAEALEKVSRTF